MTAKYKEESVLRVMCPIGEGAIEALEKIAPLSSFGKDNNKEDVADCRCAFIGQQIKEKHPAVYSQVTSAWRPLG